MTFIYILVIVFIFRYWQMRYNFHRLSHFRWYYVDYVINATWTRKWERGGRGGSAKNPYGWWDGFETCIIFYWINYDCRDEIIIPKYSPQLYPQRKLPDSATDETGTPRKPPPPTYSSSNFVMRSGSDPEFYRNQIWPSGPRDQVKNQGVRRTGAAFAT